MTEGGEGGLELGYFLELHILLNMYEAGTDREWELRNGMWALSRSYLV